MTAGAFLVAVVDDSPRPWNGYHRLMGEPQAPRISGTIVCGHLAELRNRHEGAVEAALDTLTPEDRAEVADALPIGWVRIDAYEAFYRAMGEQVGIPWVELHLDVSHVSMERTLTTVHRMLMRFTSDSGLVSRTPLIYAKSFDQGELRANVRPGRAEIEVVGWPSMPGIALRGLRVAVESVLRLSGRKDVRVTGEPKLTGAHLIATWRTN